MQFYTTLKELTTVFEIPLPNLTIIVSAYGLAPNRARWSVGTTLNIKLHLCVYYVHFTIPDFE